MNWLIFTCLLGLIPVLARLFVWMLSNSGVDPIAVGDVVAFGLVLHSANINEVNRIGGADQRWKAVHNGASILFLIGYALILFAVIASPSNLNAKAILQTAVSMSVVTFFLNFSVLLRAQAVEGASK